MNSYYTFKPVSIFFSRQTNNLLQNKNNKIKIEYSLYNRHNDESTNTSVHNRI